VIIVGKLTFKNQIEIKVDFCMYWKRDREYLRWCYVHASEIFLQNFVTYHTSRTHKSTEYDGHLIAKKRLIEPKGYNIIIIIIIKLIWCWATCWPVLVSHLEVSVIR